MSVIVAMISNRDGAVAIDGRLFGPARIEKNGHVVDPASFAWHGPRSEKRWLKSKGGPMWVRPE